MKVSTNLGTYLGGPYNPKLTIDLQAQHMGHASTLGADRNKCPVLDFSRTWHGKAIKMDMAKFPSLTRNQKTMLLAVPAVLRLLGLH